MSFSAVTKNELARIVGERSCCRLAELAALIKMGGSIHISGRHQVGLNIITENAAVARKIFSLVKNLFGLQTDVLVRRETRLRKNNVYLVRVLPQHGIGEVLGKLGVVAVAGNIEDAVPRDLVRRECCRRAYLRGVFLGSGSVSSPGGTYHLEIITGNKKFACFIGRLIRKFHINAKISRRKDRYVVYLKEGEQIVNFLNIIGAHSALLNYENTRIYKDMRNQVNRLVNCETANLNKTVNASLRQIENIKLIQETLGLEYLPEPLREISELRIMHPDSSLKELGEMAGPPLGKSGVNHRLRKIEEIADKIRSGKI